MFARMQRNLFALAIASTAVGAMVLIGQAPRAAMQASVAVADAQVLAVAPPATPVEAVPAADQNQSAIVRARPLKLSLPDFLNLGAPRRGRSPA